MADIRVRQTNKGTIRTIDRAAAMTSHIKDVQTKTREQVSGSRSQEEEQSSSGAADQMGQMVQRSAEKAAMSGAEAGQAAYRRIQGREDLRRKQKISARQQRQRMQYAKRAEKRSREAVRRALRSARTLTASPTIGGAVALLVVLVFVLFGAAFYTFRDDSSANYLEVSPEVEAYTPVISKYAQQYGIGEYVELIKAVMMQESGGRGTDPMQCSESSYNKRYPHAPGSIKDPVYSINCGVHYLADCLRQAGCKSPVDMSRIRLALQGYNFGNGYIAWAIKRDGGYTVENATVFSEQQAKKHGWSGYGDKQYPAHVLRYYPYGSYNIGVGNTAIVKVAQQQIGNAGGRKYWSWYGFSGRVSWCGCFVSWCADQCGYIKSGTIPKFSFVPSIVDWAKSHHQWQTRNYRPSPGDIIVIDWGANGTRDHVGIVEKCVGSTVYTIEGNRSDQVKRGTYMVGSGLVYGYFVPRY